MENKEIDFSDIDLEGLSDVDLDNILSEVDLDGIEDKKEQESLIVEQDNTNFIGSIEEIVVMDNVNPDSNFTFEYIDINNIAIPPSRIREQPRIEALLKSIKTTGLLEPLVIAPTATEGLYVLLSGFRRLVACARTGIKEIPCIINHKINTPDIPIVEALYNHYKKYTMEEIIKYIEYLENKKGILSPSVIEYLLQLNSGDYTKLKDVLHDNDPDITSKLYEEIFTIEQAFKALEKRRKKESADEKESKQTEKVYEEEKVSYLEDSGEQVGQEDLTEEEIKGISINPLELEDVEDESLDDLVEDGKNMKGFEYHKQDPNNREIIDPAIRKAVMSRDKDTCQCCKRGGPDWVDILDLHHIVEVYLGGVDSVENSVAVCLCCHKQIHLYAFNKLHIPETKTTSQLEAEVVSKIAEINAENKDNGKPELTEEEKKEIRESHFVIYKEEQNKYKRIIKLGNVIRKGLQMKGIKLEQAKKEHPIDKIGRQKPGEKNIIA